MNEEIACIEMSAQRTKRRVKDLFELVESGGGTVRVCIRLQAKELLRDEISAKHRDAVSSCSNSMPTLAQTDASMWRDQVFVRVRALRYARTGYTESFVWLKAERISYGIAQTFL